MKTKIEHKAICKTPSSLSEKKQIDNHLLQLPLIKKKK